MGMVSVKECLVSIGKLCQSERQFEGANVNLKATISIDEKLVSFEEGGLVSIKNELVSIGELEVYI